MCKQGRLFVVLRHGLELVGFPGSLPVWMATEGSIIGREVGSVESKKARYSLPKNSLRSKGQITT